MLSSFLLLTTQATDAETVIGGIIAFVILYAIAKRIILLAIPGGIMAIIANAFMGNPATPEAAFLVGAALFGLFGTFHSSSNQ